MNICMLFMILLKEQWSFSEICCAHRFLVLLPQPQLVRSHFLTWSLKKWTDGMAQPIGHFHWSLKREISDYLVYVIPINECQIHIWMDASLIVQIRSFFWSVFSRIQSEYGKMRTRKTPYLDTFHVVFV